MKYEVVVNFTDLDDKEALQGENVYWVGSLYPREGYEPTEERVKYLKSKKTTFGKPVIAPKGRK